MRLGLLASGHSEDSVWLTLKAHKFSTTNQYQGIWSKFMAFISMRGLTEVDISVGVVCDFLSYQAITCGRKYRTISGYRSALRHPLLFAFHVDINCVASDLFLRGVFHHIPPSRAKAMPRWSLNSLLEFLKGPLFEPLESASFLRLTQKTLCLLLLASGRRIGDIANLSRTSLPGASRGSLSLLWVSGYVPKRHTPDFAAVPPSICVLNSPLRTDVLLCPVRAFNAYVAASGLLLDGVPLSKRHPYLWLKPGSVCQWSKQAISKCFVDVVRDSRIVSDILGPVVIGPHQMRKLSASYASLVGQAEKKVIKVMGFSSVTIFRKNYVAWVPPLQVSCVLPGGTFLARKVHDLSDSE